MIRSPLFYPLNRGGDAEAGGAADLQTDVMRFMAILSLCLVAIFALVQSIPLAPSSEQPPSPDAAQDAPLVDAALPKKDLPVETAIEQVAAVRLTRPTPAKARVRNEHVVLQRPKPTPVRKTEPNPVTTENDVPVTVAEPVEKGFTLQFETDAALTRLVARQVIGMYAMTPDQSLRMNIDGNKIEFWPASVPGKFHEMDVSTVPASVLAAYPGRQKADIKWGVTLPADMTRELDGYLSSASGGSLVIASSGEIELRR